MSFVLIGLFSWKKFNKDGFAFKYGEKVVERLAFNWFLFSRVIFKCFEVSSKYGKNKLKYEILGLKNICPDFHLHAVFHMSLAF